MSPQATKLDPVLESSMSSLKQFEFLEFFLCGLLIRIFNSSVVIYWPTKRLLSYLRHPCFGDYPINQTTAARYRGSGSVLVVQYCGSVQWFSTLVQYLRLRVLAMSAKQFIKWKCAKTKKTNSSQCFFVQLEGMSWSNIRVSMLNSSIALVQLSI